MKGSGRPCAVGKASAILFLQLELAARHEVRGVDAVTHVGRPRSVVDVHRVVAHRAGRAIRRVAVVETTAPVRAVATRATRRADQRLVGRARIVTGPEGADPGHESRGRLEPDQVSRGDRAEQRRAIGDRDGVIAAGTTGERERPHRVARECGIDRGQVVAVGAVEPVGAVDSGQRREVRTSGLHVEAHDQVSGNGRARRDGETGDGDVRVHGVHFCDAKGRAVRVADAAGLPRFYLGNSRGTSGSSGSGRSRRTGAGRTGRALCPVLAVIAGATGEADAQRQKRDERHESTCAPKLCKSHFLTPSPGSRRDEKTGQCVQSEI